MQSAIQTFFSIDSRKLSRQITGGVAYSPSKASNPIFQHSIIPVKVIDQNDPKRRVVIL